MAAVGGPFFDDLVVGQVVDTAPSMTLTSGAAAVHQSIVGGRLRLALDADLAKAVTGAAGPLAHPALVCDVAIGQSTLVTQRVTANLFYRGLTFHRFPVIGDTLVTRTEVVALKQEVVDAHPWVPRSLYQAFCKARDIATDGLWDTDALRLALPWLMDHVEEAWDVFGKDFWAYGMEKNRPALDVIRLYDSKGTLFYCDPPYLHDTRGDSSAYGFEMKEDEHIDLAAALHRCVGKVAISGYRNGLMDRLYKDWRRFDAPLKQCHSIKKERQECLWMNYD